MEHLYEFQFDEHEKEWETVINDGDADCSFLWDVHEDD